MRDSTQCSLCKYVVTLVREAVNSTATLEKIEQAALQACSALPAELASTCTDFVNTYGACGPPWGRGAVGPGPCMTDCCSCGLAISYIPTHGTATGWADSTFGPCLLCAHTQPP